MEELHAGPAVDWTMNLEYFSRGETFKFFPTELIKTTMWTVGGKPYAENEAVERKCLKCFFWKKKNFVTLQEYLKYQCVWSAVKWRMGGIWCYEHYSG